MSKISLSIFSVFVMFALMLSSVSAATYGAEEDQRDARDTGFNDPDTFGDPEDDGLDFGTDTNDEGLNDPDMFGDAEDDGLDWNGDGMINDNDEPTDLNNDGSVDNGDVIIAASGNTRTATNTRTYQQNTVRATADDIRDARMACSASDNLDAADDFVAVQGDYDLVGSETLDMDIRVNIYEYSDGDQTVFVITGGCEVHGVVAENSLTYLPEDDDTRGARDGDGFITIPR